MPGIGKRTAERIIVELREKVGAQRRRAVARPARRSSPAAGEDAATAAPLARDGLIELGYAPGEADELLRDAEGESAEELIARCPARWRGARMSEWRDRTGASRRPYLVAEDELDRSLRPRRLGSSSARSACASSWPSRSRPRAARGEALDHLLLAGPPGLGKTSLAQIVAAELEVPFVQTAGPALERKGDIAAFLTALEPRSVFFVDEIHRLPRTLEETFYPAMEDHRLPITVGQGAGARVVTLELPPFTLVGATTRAGLLTTPLRDRFGIQARLEPYTVEELAVIVRRSAGILEVELDEEGAVAIAARSRGTPRVANRLLKRVRDFAEVRMEGVVTAAAARGRARDARGRRAAASTASTARSCARSASKFAGGPVGLSTLAVAVGEEQDTIEDVYEPYLLQQGLIKRTPRGRAATAAAFEHLGLEAPAPAPARRCSEALARQLTIALPLSANLTAPCVVCVADHGPSVHLPQLRSPHHRARSQPRLHAPAQGLHEVRLRVPVRTARRLLPGAGRRLLRLRRRGPGDRLRQELLRLHGPRGGGGDRPARRAGARPELRQRRRSRRDRARVGGARARGAGQVSGERDVAATAKADMFPAYDDDGGLLLVLTPGQVVSERDDRPPPQRPRPAARRRADRRLAGGRSRPKRRVWAST